MYRLKNKKMPCWRASVAKISSKLDYSMIKFYKKLDYDNVEFKNRSTSLDSLRKRTKCWKVGKMLESL